MNVSMCVCHRNAVSFTFNYILCLGIVIMPDIYKYTLSLPASNRNEYQELIK
jgi:hypothetical protein